MCHLYRCISSISVHTHVFWCARWMQLNMFPVSGSSLYIWGYCKARQVYLQITQRWCRCLSTKLCKQAADLAEGPAILLTGTLYFLRALPTFMARCPIITMLAAPVNTTSPYSLESTTILTNFKEDKQHICQPQFEYRIQKKCVISAITIF